MFIAALFIIARTWKQPRCSLTEEWINKLWYIYAMEYYSAIKKDTLESVLMRRMNLAPILQSEVSRKEKYKYRLLMHIYRIQKDGTDKFISRGAMEKKRQRTDLWTWGGGRERMGCMKRVTWKLKLPYVKQIANGNLLYYSGNSNRGSVSIQKGKMGRKMEGRFVREGTFGVPMADF